MSIPKLTSCVFTILLMIGVATTAQATVITVGALSSNDDGSTEVITDSLNNLEWLRFDVLKSLTYAETVAAIGSGGAYEGWSIANYTTAQLFVNALLYPAASTANCTATNSFGSCNTGANLISYTDGQFGNSWGDVTDSAFFLSDNGTGDEAGLLELYELGYVYKFNEFTSINNTDAQAHGSIYDTGWLLYRTQSVPEPASLLLMGIGLAGLGYARKRSVA